MPHVYIDMAKYSCLVIDNIIVVSKTTMIIHEWTQSILDEILLFFIHIFYQNPSNCKL
jgi:hypothetical protein